jgi:multiple sugar transport system permease protein
MSSTRGIMSDVEWRSPGGRLIVGIFLVILVLTSIAFLFPFLFTFTAGLKTSTEIFKPGLVLFPKLPHWQNYIEAWKRFNMLHMFLTTFYVAIGGVIGRLLVSSMAAYSISRLNPVGKTVIQTLILLTLTIPMIAYIIPLYMVLTNVPIIHVNLVNSFWGLWLPYSISAFHILVLRNSFDQIPRDIYDAAAVDGASPVNMFFSITLPLATPILLVLGLLTFVGIWGDFLLPYLILRDPGLQTVSVRLYNLTRIFPMNLQMAGSFFALLPPTIAVLVFQRYMKGGLTF